MSETARDGVTPVKSLDAAVTALEGFTYRSGPHFDERPGWEYPSDAYECVGALSELAVLLPGVFERLAGAVRDLHELHLVGIDSGPHDGDPGRSVEALGDALGRSRVAAQQMLAGLTEAQNVLGRMFYGGPDSAPGERL